MWCNPLHHKFILLEHKYPFIPRFFGLFKNKGIKCFLPLPFSSPILVVCGQIQKLFHVSQLKEIPYKISSPHFLGGGKGKTPFGLFMDKFLKILLYSLLIICAPREKNKGIQQIFYRLNFSLIRIRGITCSTSTWHKKVMGLMLGLNTSPNPHHHS